MIKKLLAKYKEIITYVLFGVLSTIVNFGAFYIFNLILGSSFYLATNIIAWFFAVAFAYVTNKLWVFESKSCCQGGFGLCRGKAFQPRS